MDEGGRGETGKGRGVVVSLVEGIVRPQRERDRMKTLQTTIVFWGGFP